MAQPILDYETPKPPAGPSPLRFAFALIGSVLMFLAMFLVGIGFIISADVDSNMSWLVVVVNFAVAFLFGKMVFLAILKEPMPLSDDSAPERDRPPHI